MNHELCILIFLASFLMTDTWESPRIRVYIRHTISNEKNTNISTFWGVFFLLFFFHSFMCHEMNGDVAAGKKMYWVIFDENGAQLEGQCMLFLTQSWIIFFFSFEMCVLVRYKNNKRKVCFTEAGGNKWEWNLMKSSVYNDLLIGKIVTQTYFRRIAIKSEFWIVIFPSRFLWSTFVNLKREPFIQNWKIACVTLSLNAHILCLDFSAIKHFDWTKSWQEIPIW